jgi:glycosyltransferase involved in cell wall biosynthesis
MPRCLCVFSRILGWNVFGRFVSEALAAHSRRFDFRYLDYGNEALRVPVPWYADFGDHSRTQWRLRRLVSSSGIAASDYDAFVFQGHDLALPFHRAFDRPVGIIADTTPAITKRRVRWQTGAGAAAKRLGSEVRDRARYRPLFAAATAFVALSEQVKESLCRDYGVAADAVFTIGPPVYDEIAALAKSPKTERPVLLFVGNDFVRKGGAFLLELYRRHFADRADLWIVSNGIGSLGPEPGVRTFADLPHAAVLDLMLRSDVFLFPSFHDELGLVLAEAACAGLPIVARESGSQREYVRHGENGYLLPQDSGVDAWRAAVDGILAATDTRRRFSANSEALGRRLCSKARFAAQMATFVGRLEGALAAD